MHWLIPAVVGLAAAVACARVVWHRRERERLRNIEVQARAVPLEHLRAIVREIVEGLVRQDYDGVARRTHARRFTADGLRAAVLDYGQKLVSPPESAYQDKSWRSCRVVRARVPTWSAAMDMWTEFESRPERSDLTLELTIRVDGDETAVEIDGLHVM
jgi:hypothetical protein